MKEIFEVRITPTSDVYDEALFYFSNCPAFEDVVSACVESHNLSEEHRNLLLSTLNDNKENFPKLSEMSYVGLKWLSFSCHPVIQNDY